MLEGKDLIGKKVRLLGTKKESGTFEDYAVSPKGKKYNKEDIVTVVKYNNSNSFYYFKEFGGTGCFSREDFELIDDNTSEPIIIKCERCNMITEVANIWCEFPVCCGEVMSILENKQYYSCEHKKLFSKKDFLNTKIKIYNSEQNKKFQKLMFDLGIRWYNKESIIQHTDIKYLYISSGGYLTYGVMNNTFDENNYKEIFYNNIFPEDFTCGDSAMGSVEHVEIIKSNLKNITETLGEYKISEETKMEKPKNKMEEKALEQAKEESIKKEVDTKAEMYKIGMSNFIATEEYAIKYRKEADELAKVLGITAEDKKKLF